MNDLPPARPQSPAYGPLQRRLLGLAGLLATLMIALIVFHAVHTGSTGLNAVAEAAERTARLSGAAIGIEAKYTVEVPGQTAPKTVVGYGNGSYNARTGRAEANLTLPVPGKGPTSIETVADARRSFLRSAIFEGELPPGKEWLEMEPFLGHDVQTALGSNGSAEDQLKLLKAVGGDVEKLDQQTVRGHLTTRYKGTVELAKAADLLSERGETALAEEYEKFAEQIPSPIPVEAWIDEKGLARQIRLVEPLPSASGGPTVTMDVRVQYFAFGSHPKIGLPPERDVFDFTPLLRAELGLEDGSTLGSLAPAAGTKPLATSQFRRHVVRVCREVAGEAHHRLTVSPALREKMKALQEGSASDEEEREALSEVGVFYERVAGLVRHATRKLARVVPPPSQAGLYRRYLLLDAKQAEWALAKGRASELGPSALRHLKDRNSEAKAEEAEGERLAKKLGISDCGKQLEESSDRQAGDPA